MLRLLRQRPASWLFASGGKNPCYSSKRIAAKRTKFWPELENGRSVANVHFKRRHFAAAREGFKLQEDVRNARPCAGPAARPAAPPRAPSGSPGPQPYCAHGRCEDPSPRRPFRDAQLIPTFCSAERQHTSSRSTRESSYLTRGQHYDDCRCSTLEGARSRCLMRPAWLCDARARHCAQSRPLQP